MQMFSILVIPSFSFQPTTPDATHIFCMPAPAFNMQQLQHALLAAHFKQPHTSRSHASPVCQHCMRVWYLHLWHATSCHLVVIYLLTKAEACQASSCCMPC